MAVMNVPLQIANINRELQNRGIAPDTVDVEALIDPSLSYPENKENILSGFTRTQAASIRNHRDAQKQMDSEFCGYVGEECEKGDKEACEASCKECGDNCETKRPDLVEQFKEKIEKAKTIKELSDINQEITKLSTVDKLTMQQTRELYALIKLADKRVLQKSSKTLSSQAEKLIKKIRSAKTNSELKAIVDPVALQIDSLDQSERAQVLEEMNRKVREFRNQKPEEKATWELLEPEAIKKYNQLEINRYQKAVDYAKQQKADLEEKEKIHKADPKDKKKKAEYRYAKSSYKANLKGLQFWERILERMKKPEYIELNKKSYHERYVKDVKAAIKKGKPVPAEVINQYPEFRKAKDARERYEKGLHTSFANKSIAVDESVKADFGVKVKRQDGKKITKTQTNEIIQALIDIQEVTGNITELMKAEDITIAHTSGKHPFLSKAGGQWHEVEKTITIGIAGTNATAHELAHFIDSASGREYDDRLIAKAISSINEYDMIDYMLKLSPKKTEEQLKNARLMRVHLGTYWRRPAEVFARLIEQYIATVSPLEKSKAFNSKDWYNNSPGWWTEAAFKGFIPHIEALLKTKLEKAFNKHGLDHKELLPGKLAKLKDKDPWQIKTVTYVKCIVGQNQPLDEQFGVSAAVEEEHREIIEVAITQGRNIPQAVLSDFYQGVKPVMKDARKSRKKSKCKSKVKVKAHTRKCPLSHSGTIQAGFKVGGK